MGPDAPARPEKDPTRRFTSRVGDYVKARPGYPDALVTALQAKGGLPTPPAERVIADVGCGTGISAELLVRHGYDVVGVEPNDAMRDAAVGALAGRSSFRAAAGTAEATGLADASVDAVVAAQAFHWFDPDAARREFRRILRRSDRAGGSATTGPVVLVWNDRRTEGTALLEAYEALLQRFAIDYNEVNHRRIDDAAVQRFFADAVVGHVTLVNIQRLDREGLRARLRSSSYVPPEGHPDFDPMMAELDRIFDGCQRDGVVEVLYDVRGWFGSWRLDDGE